MAICGRADEIGLVLGKLKPLGKQGLYDILSILGGGEDEVGVVCCDEEDGDACKGSGHAEVYNAASSIKTGADYGQDGIGILGYGHGLGHIFGECPDGRLEDVFGPFTVTHDGALYGSNADVEKGVLAIGRESQAL